MSSLARSFRFGPCCLGLALLWGAAAGAQSRPPNPVEALRSQVAANAEAIQSLEAETTLSDLSCDVGDVPEYDGSQWACAPGGAPAPVFYTNSYDITLPTDPDLPVNLSGALILCDVGDAVVSGGYAVPFGGNHFATQSRPTFASGREGWTLSIQSLPTTLEPTATFYVRCMDLTP
jgi:hypothetical protein